MNGVTFAGAAFIPAVTDPSWTIAGRGDFDGDGRADILWRNTGTGANAIWRMNGSSVALSSAIPTVATASGWTIVGVGDFNGDGKDDILWRNVSGDNAIWLMSGFSLAGASTIPAVSAAGWTIVGVGDFNRDGRADVVWRNTISGANAIWLMNGFTLASGVFIPSVPTTWSVSNTR
jgi:hypothetical protein